MSVWESVIYNVILAILVPESKLAALGHRVYHHENFMFPMRLLQLRTLTRVRYIPDIY
jgi:hypothetical protein